MSPDMIYHDLLGNQELILVIDDDLNITNLAKELFELHNYKIMTARDCEDGIKKYQKNNVALVLLDVAMPFKDGYECMLLLKKLDPDVKVIGWSGYVTDRMLRRMGAKAFFKKPVAFLPILETVKTILKGESPEQLL